jgi:hypothetical protein
VHRSPVYLCICVATHTRVRARTSPGDEMRRAVCKLAGIRREKPRLSR